MPAALRSREETAPTAAVTGISRVIRTDTAGKRPMAHFSGFSAASRFGRAMPRETRRIMYTRASTTAYTGFWLLQIIFWKIKAPTIRLDPVVNTRLVLTRRPGFSARARIFSAFRFPSRASSSSPPPSSCRAAPNPYSTASRTTSTISVSICMPE